MTKFSRLLLAIAFVLPMGLAAQTTPAGTWKMTIPDQDGKDVPVQVVITDSGTYAVDFGVDGKVDISGKYTIDGDKMMIQDDAGSECTAKGVYTFKTDGKSLTMTRVSDECEGRGGPDGVMKMDRGSKD